MTLVSKYPIKATSDTVSVDPLLLFQQLITVRYRCAKVWAMCLSSSTIWGYWQHAAIWQTISSKYHTGMSTPFTYSIPPGCQLHIWWRCCDTQNSMENWTYESLCGRYIEYVKQIWLTKVLSVWWLPRWSFSDGRNHLAVTLLIQKRQPRYTA